MRGTYCTLKEGSRPNEGEEYVVDDLRGDAVGWRGAGEEDLVTEQVGGEGSYHRADIGAGLAPVDSALEDGRHDPGADVQDLVLDAGEQFRKATFDQVRVR